MSSLLLSAESPEELVDGVGGTRQKMLKALLSLNKQI